MDELVLIRTLSSALVQGVIRVEQGGMAKTADLERQKIGRRSPDDGDGNFTAFGAKYFPCVCNAEKGRVGTIDSGKITGILELTVITRPIRLLISFDRVRAGRTACAALANLKLKESVHASASEMGLSMALLATAPGFVIAGPADQTGAPAAAASSNQAMATKIATALKAAPLKGKGVQLQFDKGVCTITGEAADAQQKALATQVISSVPGVSSVNNQLSVSATAARPMPGGVMQAGFEGAPRQSVRQVQAEMAAPAASNQETAQAIADALSTAGLTKFDIEVRFSSGTCTLSGSVTAPEVAAKAEECARSVAGVQNVTNRITVFGRPAVAPQQAVMPAGYPQTAYAPQQSPYAPQMAANPQMGMPPGMGMQMSQQQIQQMGLRQPGQAPMAMQPGPGMVTPAGHQMYNQPNVPEYAWPSYAAPDNSAAITYPGQYDASAFPYIGPYYPYPQVPLGWRKSTLEWKDGSWNLKFSSRTDRWWWFMNPHNWTE